MVSYFLLNLPNPSGRNIYRAFAGGFGTLGSASKDDVLFPIFLLYGCSAMLDFGRNYNVIDAQALNYTPGQVVEVIKRDPPDVLITWPSLPSLNDDIKLLTELKKVSPQTLIIALGTPANVLTWEVLKGAALVIKGHYPHYKVVSKIIETLDGSGPVSIEALRDIKGAVYIKDGRIVENPLANYVEDVDQLNLEAYHKLPVKKYVSHFVDRDGTQVGCIPILTGVGCPYGCSYCPYPVGYGARIITKSNENIIKEIEFLYENFGIKGFVFREQAFTHDRDRTMEFCNEIIRRGLKIRWLIETRVDLVDRELLTKMEGAGCFRIHYGVETGDEELLSTKGKPGLKLEEIKTAFSETKSAGIYAHAHVMVGFPKETEKTVNNTIKILREINPDHININIVTPYPGTRFFEETLKNGPQLSTDWSQYTSYDPVMETEAFNKEQIKKARDKVKSEFRKFKILNDPTYRKLFFLKLPVKIKNRLIGMMNKDF